jgi:hypothetical protein
MYVWAVFLYFFLRLFFNSKADAAPFLQFKEFAANIKRLNSGTQNVDETLRNVRQRARSFSPCCDCNFLMSSMCFVSFVLIHCLLQVRVIFGDRPVLLQKLQRLIKQVLPVCRRKII